MNSEPTISVVIPTHNRKYLLKKCLESLVNQTYPRDKYEIITVDDGSNDKTDVLIKEMIRKVSCELRYFNQENKGPAAARNLGILNAKGEIIAFIDDDCIAPENWLADLVGGFNNKIGGVGGLVKQSEFGNIFSRFEAFGWETTVSCLGYVEWLATNNAAFRKDVLTKINGFDEKFKKPGSEDIDLSLRIIEEGFRLKRIDTKIIHIHRNSFKQIIQKAYTFGQNSVILTTKHHKLRKVSIRPLAYLLLPILLVLSFQIPYLLYFILAIYFAYHSQDFYFSLRILKNRDIFLAISYPPISFLGEFAFIFGQVFYQIKSKSLKDLMYTPAKRPNLLMLVYLQLKKLRKKYT